MESIIKELWHGNIVPQEDSRIHSKEMKELLEHIARHHEALMKSFTDEQKKPSKNFTIVGVSTQVLPKKQYSYMPFSLACKLRSTEY